MDSGDLAYLSKEVTQNALCCRISGCGTISASNDLDEYLIESLKAQDAEITSWGVGTHLITSKDNPAFGGVYKLAAVKNAGAGGIFPKIKLSENTEKVTNPGDKIIYRIYAKPPAKSRQTSSV